MNIDKKLFKYVEKFYEIQKSTNGINNKWVNSDNFAITRPFLTFFFLNNWLPRPLCFVLNRTRTSLRKWHQFLRELYTLHVPDKCEIIQNSTDELQYNCQRIFNFFCACPVMKRKITVVWIWNCIDSLFNNVEIPRHFFRAARCGFYVLTNGGNCTCITLARS